jgi:hypothetical protein
MPLFYDKSTHASIECLVVALTAPCQPAPWRRCLRRSSVDPESLSETCTSDITLERCPPCRFNRRCRVRKSRYRQPMRLPTAVAESQSRFPFRPKHRRAEQCRRRNQPVARHRSSFHSADFIQKTTASITVPASDQRLRSAGSWLMIAIRPGRTLSLAK